MQSEVTKTSYTAPEISTAKQTLVQGSSKFSMARGKTEMSSCEADLHRVLWLLGAPGFPASLAAVELSVRKTYVRFRGIFSYRTFSSTKMDAYQQGTTGRKHSL